MQDRREFFSVDTVEQHKSQLALSDLCSNSKIVIIGAVSETIAVEFLSQVTRIDHQSDWFDGCPKTENAKKWLVFRSKMTLPSCKYNSLLCSNFAWNH